MSIVDTTTGNRRCCVIVLPHGEDHPASEEQDVKVVSQRQAAAVLLDAVSAFDHEQGATPENEAAVRLALERLQEVEAITVTVNDETDEVAVDATPVLGASLAIITLLVRCLAEAHNADPDATLATVREQVDQILN